MVYSFVRKAVGLEGILIAINIKKKMGFRGSGFGVLVDLL